MKSLALHLVVILLLGTLHTNHFQMVTASTAAVADSPQSQRQQINNATARLIRSRGVRFFDGVSTSTTTASPSLRAPLSHRRLATVPITAATAAPSKSTTTAEQKQQQQQQQHRRRQSTIKKSTTKSESTSEIFSPNSKMLAHANLAAANRRRQQNVAPVSIPATTTASATTSSPVSSSPLSLSTRTLRERTARDTLNRNLVVANNDLSDDSSTGHKNPGGDTRSKLQNRSNNIEKNNSDGEQVGVGVDVDVDVGAANNYNRRQYKSLERRQTFKDDSEHVEPQQQQSPITATTTSQQQQQQQRRSKNYIKPSSPVLSASQTLKTPRMIQRLVAGHIQNSQGRSTFEVSAVTTNSTTSNTFAVKATTSLPRLSTTKTAATTTTTAAPLLWTAKLMTTTPASVASTPLFFRRKPTTTLSSSYRHGKHDAKSSTTTTTSTSAPQTYYDPDVIVDEHDDDEALLDDPGDFDNWDNGILRLSAGSGKENGLTKSKKGKEDSKKTLADQVRDGKYGLIEKELFRRDPKRPGILSYLPNKEVPYDNEHNLGGLNEEDIWLAEDHLLVIKGGSLNEGAPSAVESWPPIDDYNAPGRQIKLPKHPKVPPPFPVQLEENGPIQFIGNNKFTVVYPLANESLPVYTAGPETNYSPSEGDGNNEKNLIARPGTPQDPTEEGPGYFYPAPYPPWIYHNQTFVNPFLKNARPITFPGLGPFPIGRNNGSIDNINSTTIDDFDEDDPSLYYPPAYSFVYKSNYTNAVPPGPLVPGIVLPPPPDQFSRLEKHEKVPTLSSRQRPTSSPTTPSPITTTSSPTTSSTTTTTPAPFRQNVITKISEYTPKVITITPSPPGAILSTTKLPPTPPPTPPPRTSQTPFEPVPVPVAVPVPIYPINYNPTSRPNIVSFVPTTPESSTVDTLSKSNPIYYEYFEAKRQPGFKSNVIDEFLSTTVKPLPLPKPIKLYAANKRPFKTQQPQAQRNYLPQRAQYLSDSSIVYITPKPQPQVQAPVFKPRPLENFEREVNALRETLRFYKNQQLRDNTIPRTAKAKPIYEYSFDATKNIQPGAPDTGNFQPPEEFDEEPFKPMVTYSPAVNDKNAFKAIAYDKADNKVSAPQTAPQQLQPKYQTTTTLVPVQPEPQYRTLVGRPKKLRLGAKYLPQPLNAGYDQPATVYGTTPRTVITTQLPWESLDVKEQEQQPHHRSERLQVPQPLLGNKHRNFNGYYYRQPLGPPPPPAPVQTSRQNNRFYDEPFHNPVRKIINYRPQSLPPHQQQPPQAQQQWSLENDTYVNYAPNRPPVNPDAEFINPYHTLPLNIYAPQPQRLGPQQPALSHQSQYYAPPQRYPVRQLPPPLSPQQQSQPQQEQVSLHHDIHVNYRPPLPPINPNSEYIPHTQMVRNQGNQLYRAHSYRFPGPSAIGPSGPNNDAGDSANLYYITPKYRRATSNTNQHVNKALSPIQNAPNANQAGTSAELYDGIPVADGYFKLGFGPMLNCGKL